MHSYALFVVAAAMLATTCQAFDLSGDFKDGCPRRPHPQLECPHCELTTNTSGYLVDPCNETCYYQCWMVDGEWTISEPVCCPCCTYFNTTLLTCVLNPNVACAVPNLVVEEFSCQLQPCNNPSIFLNGNESQPCPEGTLFKEENCTCIHDPKYPPPISMNYTIRSTYEGNQFNYTVELATTRSPFIVMIRLAKKLYTHFTYTSKVIQNYGDYILSVNGLHEIQNKMVWVFLKEQNGVECIPFKGINEYRVEEGENLILSYLPRKIYNDMKFRCP